MGGGDNSIDETPQQQALAEVSMKRWQDYLTKYRPYEDQYMQDVDRMNDENQYTRSAGLAAVPVESNFTQAVMQSADQMAGAGINPNSGMFKAELEKIEQKKNKAKADGMSQAQFGQQSRYVGGLQNVVRMGQGQATEATQGLMDVAGMANQKAASDAGLDAQKRYGNQQVAGGVIGAGVSYGLNSTNKNPIKTGGNG